MACCSDGHRQRCASKKATHLGGLFLWVIRDYFASAGFTNALIFKMVCPGSVLALMVTVLVWLFFFPLELNLTSISPAAPGAPDAGAPCAESANRMDTHHCIRLITIDFAMAPYLSYSSQVFDTSLPIAP